MQFSQNHDHPSEWSHMILSVDTFFTTMTNVTGVELPTFIDQWIFNGGHADFKVKIIGLNDTTREFLALI